MPTTRRTASATTNFESLKKKSRIGKLPKPSKNLAIQPPNTANNNKRKRNKSNNASPSLKSKHQKVNKDYLDEDANNLEDDTEMEEYNSDIINSPNNNVENNSRPSIEITPQPPSPMVS